MSRYDDDDDFEDDRFDVRRRRFYADDRPHSGQGIVAVVLAILAAIGAEVATVFAVVLDAGGPVDDDDPLTIVTVLLFAGAGLGGLGGLLLGFAAMFQSDRKPTYAVTGVTANALILFGIVVLICMGIFSDM